MKIVLMLLLLALFSVANAVAEEQVPEFGVGAWQNELGSKMLIENYDSTTGVFSGRYNSPVGAADGYYQMVGRKDTAGNTLGWTVVWTNGLRPPSLSTTTWSGQLQFNDQGDPTILTTWLLTSQTIAVDNWKSTTVGKDNFVPYIPSTKAEL